MLARRLLIPNWTLSVAPPPPPPPPVTHYYVASQYFDSDSQMRQLPISVTCDPVSRQYVFEDVLPDMQPQGVGYVDGDRAGIAGHFAGGWEGVVLHKPLGSGAITRYPIPGTGYTHLLRNVVVSTPGYHFSDLDGNILGQSSHPSVSHNPIFNDGYNIYTLPRESAYFQSGPYPGEAEFSWVLEDGDPSYGSWTYHEHTSPPPRETTAAWRLSSNGSWTSYSIESALDGHWPSRPPGAEGYATRHKLCRVHAAQYGKLSHGICTANAYYGVCRIDMTVVYRGPDEGDVPFTDQSFSGEVERPAFRDAIAFKTMYVLLRIDAGGISIARVLGWSTEQYHAGLSVVHPWGAVYFERPAGPYVPDLSRSVTRESWGMDALPTDMCKWRSTFIIFDRHGDLSRFEIGGGRYYLSMPPGESRLSLPIPLDSHGVVIARGDSGQYYESADLETWSPIPDVIRSGWIDWPAHHHYSPIGD